MFENISKLLY